MAVLSISEVPKLKERTAEFGYNLHMHDACGGPSFSLEAIPGAAADQGVYPAIEAFFAAYGMTVQFFGRERLGFTAR